MGKTMADNNQDIKSDASGSAVKFRSTGTNVLPPSAGIPVTVTGTAKPLVHGTVNVATPNVPQIVFDNPA